MKTRLQFPRDPTVQQLLERERSLRIMASTALTLEETNTLLGLAEHYESLVTKRQIQEQRERC
jgi:hypothetical protein